VNKNEGFLEWTQKSVKKFMGFHRKIQLPELLKSLPRTKALHLK